MDGVYLQNQMHQRVGQEITQMLPIYYIQQGDNLQKANLESIYQFQFPSTVDLLWNKV